MVKVTIPETKTRKEYTELVPPLVIDLNGENGCELRKKASKYVENNWNKGENFKEKMQKNKNQSVASKKLKMKLATLAEMVIRKRAGLRPKRTKYSEERGGLSADAVSKKGVIMDIKMEQVTKNFVNRWDSGDGYEIMLDSKHNLYVKQVHHPKLKKTELYIITRLRMSGKKFPGGKRGKCSNNEKNWKLWVCGWISKKRVLKEGVIIPLGNVSERNFEAYMAYKKNNIEVYQHTLNGITDLKQFFKEITKYDVEKDAKNKYGNFRQSTIADAQRVLQHLVFCKCITKREYDKINDSLDLKDVIIPPILHQNHIFSVVRHFIRNKQLGDSVLKKLEKLGIKETKASDLSEIKSLKKQ